MCVTNRPTSSPQSTSASIDGWSVELVGTCARRLEQAEQTSAAFGAGHAYDSVAALVAAGDLDAVMVSVPPEAYLEVVLPLLSAGVPVFCEKPGAANLEQLARIEAESIATGVPVMVGNMKRFAARTGSPRTSYDVRNSGG